jgi:signal transduction histidine kinase
VRQSRIFRTTAFRHALTYSALFGLSVALLFAFVYWQTTSFATEQMRTAITAESAALALEARKDGSAGLARTIDARLRSAGGRSFDYLLIDRNGQTLIGNLLGVSPAPGWSEVHQHRLTGISEEMPDDTILLFGAELPDGARLFVGQSTDSLVDLRQLVAEAFAGAGAVTVGFALLGGLLMSGTLLRRVETVNTAAARIIDGDLANRIPERGTQDEFDRLAGNLNRMLDRIEHLMAGLRQVSSDIAHDLRTPLAHLRQRLEAARLKALSPEDYKATIDLAIAQTDEILSTFSALLRIAEIEAGANRSAFTELDLSEVFARIRDIYAPVIEDEGRILSDEIEPGLTVRGDRELLTQMVANLVENAIRHTPPGTRIQLLVKAGERSPVGIVADSGPGIPEEMRSKVLQRFFRLEISRTTPGSGLGLSLAAAIADLHGIALTLEDNQPGLRVRLEFAPR